MQMRRILGRQTLNIDIFNFIHRKVLWNGTQCRTSFWALKEINKLLTLKQINSFNELKFIH